MAKVSTIAPGVPFVDAIAAEVLTRHGGEPLALPRVTLLLPTRRACLALRDAFLRRSDGRALLLPRILPLGDVDLDELEPVEAEGFASIDLPPAINETRRRLLLARLIGARRDLAENSPEHTIRLAAELARLLDQVETERLSFAALETLVPDAYAIHWQRTLDFLKLVTEAWPEVLAEIGRVDPAERRDRALAALVARWSATPPDGPVIAAGSTGSIPATADLLALIARLPEGEVVLPGLDRDCDPATWEAIDPPHPQYGLKRLLDHIGIDRERVVDWPLAADITATATAGPAGRAALLFAALRPAETTDGWRALPPPPEAALAGVTRVDSPGPREEAGVIALEMRRALETPGRTAALVTRDRALARRVSAELGRWDIAIDDSAGRPLADTPTGSFLRLVAALAAPTAGPIEALAALKHPLAAGGLAPGQFRGRVRALERRVLRGPRPGPGLAGVAHALGAVEAPQALQAWAADLVATVAPLTAVLGRPETTLAEAVEAHVAVAEKLAASASEDGAARLWLGDAGEAAAAFLAELIENADAMPLIDGRAYAALFEALIEGRVARPRHGGHPRLNIWGPLEARLQHADVIILGGLNEGSWPPEPTVDPWLGRPMRAAFGLPAPERRIGLSAHDFVHCAAAPRVLLTRAEKVEGAPTVPSRWLARIEHLLAGWNRAAAWAPTAEALAWHRALDDPGRIEPCSPPAPRPPRAARPRQLPVTAIETWMRDPYAIYARRILKLRPLDPIDADPGAAERGSFIHAALDRFLRDCPDALPVDALERLLTRGREAFGDALDRPTVWAFWWPRFERVAGWFIANERLRRPALSALASEVEGRLVASPAGRDFTLIAKADRIERRTEGGLAVIDYKTGATPTKKAMIAGLAPQLPLEALIASRGGFAGIAADRVVELAHWRLTGGDPPGTIVALGADGLAALIDAAGTGLERLIVAFDDPATPYHAVPDLRHGPRFTDYAHLARVKEWAEHLDDDAP